MPQVYQRIPGINSQVSPSLNTGTRADFLIFPIFKLWITVSPKLFKQILADLFAETRNDHSINAPSFMEIH